MLADVEIVVPVGTTLEGVAVAAVAHVGYDQSRVGQTALGVVDGVECHIAQEWESAAGEVVIALAVLPRVPFHEGRVAAGASRHLAAQHHGTEASHRLGSGRCSTRAVVGGVVGESAQLASTDDILRSGLAIGGIGIDGGTDDNFAGLSGAHRNRAVGRDRGQRHVR